MVSAAAAHARDAAAAAAAAAASAGNWLSSSPLGRRATFLVGSPGSVASRAASKPKSRPPPSETLTAPRPNFVEADDYVLVDPKSEREVTSPTTRATPSVPSTTRAVCRDSPPSPPRDGAPARVVSAARPFDATFVADACASARSPSTFPASLALAASASASATSSATPLPDARRRPARSPVALERVAAALRDAAAERWESGRRLDALAASMVALDALREARRVAVELVAEAEAEAAKARDAGNVEGERAARDEATSREKTASRVKTAFVAALRRAERAEAATRSAGAAGSAVMPSGARATREAAARLGRAGSAEELVGNLAPAAEGRTAARTRSSRTRRRSADGRSGARRKTTTTRRIEEGWRGWRRAWRREGRRARFRRGGTRTAGRFDPSRGRGHREGVYEGVYEGVDGSNRDGDGSRRGRFESRRRAIPRREYRLIHRRVGYDAVE